jgi:hypothetical protein
MNTPDAVLSWLRSTPLAGVRLRGLAVDAGAVRKLAAPSAPPRPGLNQLA